MSAITSSAPRAMNDPSRFESRSVRSCPCRCPRPWTSAAAARRSGRCSRTPRSAGTRGRGTLWAPRRSASPSTDRRGWCPGRATRRCPPSRRPRRRRRRPSKRWVDPKAPAPSTPRHPTHRARRHASQTLRRPGAEVDAVFAIRGARTVSRARARRASRHARRSTNAAAVNMPHRAEPAAAAERARHTRCEPRELDRPGLLLPQKFSRATRLEAPFAELIESFVALPKQARGIRPCAVPEPPWTTTRSSA